MDKQTAVRLRRKFEKTVGYVAHDMFCLFSDGTIIRKYPCTCGSKKIEYANVLDEKKR